MLRKGGLSSLRAPWRFCVVVMYVWCVYGLLDDSSLVLADIPASCVAPEWEGEWIFELGPQNRTKDVLDCGHGDKSISMYSNFYYAGNNLVTVEDGADFKPGQRVSLTVTLEDNPMMDLLSCERRKATASLKGVEGKVLGSWTTMFKEGIEVVFMCETKNAKGVSPKLQFLCGRRFSAFSYFDKDHRGEDSACTRTFVGKAYGPLVDAASWGCWKGTKNQVQQTTTSKALLQASSTTIKHAISSRLHKLHAQSAVYHNHDDYIALLNKHAHGGWTATAYSFLEGKSVASIQRMAGAARLHRSMKRGDAEHGHAKDAKTLEWITPEDLKSWGMPKNFDWRCVGPNAHVTSVEKKAPVCHNGESYVDDVVDQGECGACYAVSATSMVNMRLRIKSNNKVKAQYDYNQVLRCDQQSQGCAGGYPYHVMEYGQSYGFIPGKSPDDDSTQVCPVGDAFITSERKTLTGTAEPTARVRGFGYIGGLYGNVYAKGIFDELWNCGPVTTGIGGQMDFLHYKSGVYSPVNIAHPYYTFEAVGHAVAIVGWETDAKGQVNYIIKNSYGVGFGESGYMRIRAGKDESHVESMSIWADVEEGDSEAFKTSPVETQCTRVPDPAVCASAGHAEMQKVILEAEKDASASK